MPTALIDTHFHILPPAYRALQTTRGLSPGGVPVPAWSRESALATMDDTAIRVAILSISTPGTHFGSDAQARSLARELNEYSAETVKDRPDRFGFFAVLTLPDVDGALAEAAYALDELGADGVVLLANSRGTYLGDPAVEPLFAELGRRGATVFVHPNELPGLDPLALVPSSAADFLLDTTRAALNLARSGTLDRYPDLRVILSHAGGFLPYAAMRMAAMAAPDGDLSHGLELLQRFWFDLALSSSAFALPSLLAFAKPERVLYGSDFPFVPLRGIKAFASALDGYPLGPAQRQAIEHRNAEALFPRFALD